MPYCGRLVRNLGVFGGNLSDWNKCSVEGKKKVGPSEVNFRSRAPKQDQDIGPRFHHTKLTSGCLGSVVLIQKVRHVKLERNSFLTCRQCQGF